MSNLAGKVAVVTGGGSGIGLAVARAFLNEDVRVAISGRNADKLRSAVDNLGGIDRVLAIPVDVANPDQVQKLVAQVMGQWGKIDILVNNAGVNIKKRTFRELTTESWQLLLRANLDGAFYCIQAVLPHMLARKDGVIINISSIAAKRPGPLSGAAYAASKAGMHALGMCLAAEEKDSGVRLSNICPGEVDTPILEERPKAVGPEQRKLILQPEDVALAVLFVAKLPPRVSVPEMIIKPTAHVYV